MLPKPSLLAHSGTLSSSSQTAPFDVGCPPLAPCTEFRHNFVPSIRHLTRAQLCRRMARSFKRVFGVQSQGSHELVYSSNSKGALYCDVDVELQNKQFKAMKRVNGVGILRILVYSSNLNHVCGPMHRAKTTGDRKSMFCGKKNRAVTVKTPCICQQVADQNKCGC